MVTVIDYGMGNIGSIVNMLRRLNIPATLASTPAQVADARKIILPGVGAFDHGMANLHQRGLVGELTSAVIDRGIPILGICLGLQLFSRRSEEGKKPGLGWLAADTIRFRFASANEHLKVPHMGWTGIEVSGTDPVFGVLPQEPRFYFVHSYHLTCDDSVDVAGWSTYGYRFAAAVRKENIWGTQFHPEKSHKYGLALLQNFGALA